MPKIYHVVASSRNGVIGKDNKLPWHFSEDLKQFKQLTMGSTVIMGRKTFESIAEATKGKLLPGREMVVLSRKRSGGDSALSGSAPQVRYEGSLETAIQQIGTPTAFIIGGAEIYKNTMDAVDGIYLTRIDADYEGDAFYPEVPDSFEEVEIQCLREVDPRIDVVFYEKKNASYDA